MRKLPNGISNYEELVEDNCLYVDKTMYIKKLENLEDKRIMFLRPRKFGKTLFTSVLENYYDILKADKFEKLFGNTDIGKNPTANKNKYHILRFNFSGISTITEAETIEGFKREVASSVDVFVKKYGLDFYVNINDEAEYILDNLFKAFYIQKAGEKIYVIIDEYDHFANELLGFETEKFKNLVSKNGKVRKWYEILKKGTETVVERIFITGVAPITLDSTTSGFNIARDITKDLEFNDMLGFCEKDVVYLMDELQIPKEKQKELLPVIKENYDGYVFSDLIDDDLTSYKIYNSNMTLYFLSRYNQFEKIPKTLIDTNIISDYRKIEGFMNLCNDIGKIDLLQKIVAGEYVESEITEKFNSEISFGEKELISLLFYLGYLTIANIGFSKCKFKAPNDVIRKIYSDYFLTYISKRAEINEEKIDTEAINFEILETGNITKILGVLGTYLTNLSNRDYQNFDEKYIKVLFYSIAKTLGTMLVKSELEVGGEYSDILMIPKEKLTERYGILIEFKYIKKEKYTEELLKEKQAEARKQLQKYKSTEEIKMIPKLRSYSIVAIKDKLIVEEI
ncbi:MAG: AAA family ATPase [Clostridia bacterium]|nr:AAA family ATPase [Clostridia bacterium]